MEKIYDVYSLGSAIVDVQARVEDDVIVKMRSEKGSMKLISEVQLEQLLHIISSNEHYVSCGGSAANSMVAVAQLGGKSVFSNVVGGDEYGELFAREMSRLGVHFNRNILQGHRTSTCVVLTTPDAERTMFTHLGASSYISEEVINEELIAQSKWLYIEGYVLATQKGEAITNKMIEIAQKYDTKIAFSCSDIFITDLYRKKILALADKVGLVFGNCSEAARLLQVDVDGALFEKFKNTFANVIMTMGAKGVKASLYDKVYEVPSFKVKAVDTTGAGDMFAGAFLFCETHQFGVESAIRVANFLSAQIVCGFGARLEVIPDYSDLV